MIRMNGDGRREQKQLASAKTAQQLDTHGLIIVRARLSGNSEIIKKKYELKPSKMMEKSIFGSVCLPRTHKNTAALHSSSPPPPPKGTTR